MFRGLDSRAVSVLLDESALCSYSPDTPHPGMCGSLHVYPVLYLKENLQSQGVRLRPCLDVQLSGPRVSIWELGLWKAPCIPQLETKPDSSGTGRQTGRFVIQRIISFFSKLQTWLCYFNSVMYFKMSSLPQDFKPSEYYFQFISSTCTTSQDINSIELPSRK